MRRRFKRKRDGQIERGKWIERLKRNKKRDAQGYGMFSGSSVDVCGGPVLQRGGALRRINGRGAVAR